MPVSIERALEHALITVVKSNKRHGIFQFRLGKLKTVITITLFFNDEDGLWWFEPSHMIKTPVQSGAYRPGIRKDCHRGSLLLKAITGLTSYYRMAKREGYRPKEKWLAKWS
jgi:hypothetical protein